MEAGSIGPADLSSGSLYDLLTAAIAPRPIALVSTISADGQANLAPFSFFMLGGIDPPSVCFSPTLGREGAPKHTLLNIESTREFVVNLVDRPLIHAMNEASFNFPRHIDEAVEVGLDMAPCEIVRPSRVASSPMALECQVVDIVLHGTRSGAARYVIGEVVRMHLSHSVWNAGALDLSQLHPIGREGSQAYLDSKGPERFELPRPGQ